MNNGISKITYAHDITLVTLSALPCDSKAIANVLTAMSNAEVNVDMISQTAPQGGTIRLSFSLSDSALSSALAVLGKIRGENPEVKPEILPGNCKVALYDANMVNTPGVAAKVFTLLAEAGYTVEEIQSFEDLKAVAEDIHARSAELGFDAFTSSSMSDDSSWRFTGHLANLEYYYESVDDPDAWKECPSSIKGTYMQNYKNLWDLYINNSAVNPADLAAGGFDAADEFGKEQAVFYQNGSWEWAKLTGTGDGQYGLDNLSMIPFYCGVAGEENAGLNCGTENCWAVNAKASEEDIQATLEFMNWMVTDPEASRMLVDEFAAMPYKQAAESTNGFLADANDYTTNGNYIMPWVTNFQPNVDAYRAALVSAMNQYDADQSDANWELVKTAFVDGWATQYAAANG